jgi:uncharacterized RDD family membrane protein YckC
MFGRAAAGGVRAALGRRLASIAYESLLVFAIVFLSAFLFPGARSESLTGWSRHLFQLYVFLVLGLYFVWCWSRGGQTLPMKTWKLKLVRSGGAPVPVGLAVWRYVVVYSWIVGFGSAVLWAIKEQLYWTASLALACLCADIFWVLLDRDGQFAHDRLAGTRVVRAGP